MLVIREATSVLQNERLVGCNLYVTLEPCPRALGQFRSHVKRLYYGAADEKAGGADHGVRAYPSCHHRPEVYGGIEEFEQK